MPISRRYTPEHPPGESCLFGLDYSFIIPPGVGIAAGALSILTNTVPPVAADADWQVGPVTVRGRTVYCRLSGGVEGKDYQLRWVATDTQGNVFPRTALCLCAQTS
jgi:hypothetical protein